MTNPSILAAFDRMWQHITARLMQKSDIGHTHNDMYYTKSEIDTNFAENSSITLKSWTAADMR